MNERVIYETNLPLELFKRGKVRDIYKLSENKLLMVATDRISCFDVVLSNGIPGKGKILTEMSNFWFGFTQNIIENHLFMDLVPDVPNS